MLRDRGPDFLPVNDEVVALLDGARLQRGEIGSRVRFRISLAPDFLAREDFRQMALFLFLGAPVNQRRAEQADAHAGEWNAGPGAFEFLMIDDVLQHSGAAAAVFFRPADADPLALVELLMPADRFAPAIAFLGKELARGRDTFQIGLKPSAELVAKRLVLGTVVEIHCEFFPVKFRFYLRLPFG